MQPLACLSYLGSPTGRNDITVQRSRIASADSVRVLVLTLSTFAAGTGALQ